MNWRNGKLFSEIKTGNKDQSVLRIIQSVRKAMVTSFLEKNDSHNYQMSAILHWSISIYTSERSVGTRCWSRHVLWTKGGHLGPNVSHVTFFFIRGGYLPVLVTSLFLEQRWSVGTLSWPNRGFGPKENSWDPLLVKSRFIDQRRSVGDPCWSSHVFLD